MQNISLDELYRAYRKAKHEAFADATQPTSLEFVEYEASLHENLTRLRKWLKQKRLPWYSRKSLVSGFTYLPKSIEPQDSSGEEKAHFSSGDQTKDWAKKFGNEKEKAEVDFRLVIVPTVDFQIISALWVIHVGRTLDEVLDDRVAYGNRPRKKTSISLDEISTDDDSYALFKPYFSGYREWRENGLKAMKAALESNKSVVAVTMDARRYYHSISPSFLLSQSFLRNNNIELTDSQILFTKHLILALEHWHKLTPEYDGTNRGAVPVGLSASKIIANVLLAEFDCAVLENLKCKYYGRYVDDIFLVLEEEGFESAADVMQSIRERLDGYVVLERPKGGSVGLRVTLPYGDHSKVVFSGAKQKIFMLSGDHGVDLVRQIADQVRKSSSEYRLIPSLGEVDQILAGALLASTDAAIEADTLRKAEAMSIRRHGLSIATRNLEGYARDVKAEAWSAKRESTYGLILRHVITPVGLFNYTKYIIRVFGVMISCGDWIAAVSLLDKVNESLQIVKAGIEDCYAARLTLMTDVYRRGLLEAALSSSTVSEFSFDPEFRKILRRLDPDQRIFEASRVSTVAAQKFSRKILMADLGRRAYKDYWYNDNPKVISQPRLPEIHFIRQLATLISGLKHHIVRKLNDPFWPAMAFATRPPTLPELCLMMPGLMKDPDGLAKALLAIRGAGVPQNNIGSALVSPKDSWVDCRVPFSKRDRRITVAVPSYLTTDKQWSLAVKGSPDLSLSRYEGLTSLINSIIERAPGVDYIALPECSVPFHWAFSIAKSLSRGGVSFICGLEPTRKRGVYRNDALVSLATTYGGYRSSLIFRQPKLELARHEAQAVKKAGLKFQKPPHPFGRPIYLHGDFIFSTLLCSDLTNIDNRRVLQGEIDALFVLEWNPDIETFSYLVESTSHDLHVPVIQVNNRKYGDSRIRAPYKKDYDRDVVRLKGGDHDFYVVASFDVKELRKYQSKPKIGSKVYKPLPIGYSMALRRKFPV